MKTIKDVEVFAVGRWNDRDFTAGDLDEMLHSFRALKLDGRLPAKFGHDRTDTGAPAQGWITNLRRSGDKLVADLTHVPDVTYAAIRQGRWRHVSAEILVDVQGPDGERYPYVLDGLALLGAARPAVTVLEGLHKLVAAALPGLAWKQRLAFQFEYTPTAGDDSAMSETEKALIKQVINLKFSAAIKDGLILPEAQTKFERRYKDGSATIADADEWIATTPRPLVQFTGKPTSAGAGGTPLNGRPQGRQFDDPSAELVYRVKAAQADAQKAGERLSYTAAAKLVFDRQDPESRALVAEYMTMYGQT